MNISSLPFCFSASMYFLGKSKTSFPSSNASILTTSPKISSLIDMSKTVPPLIEYNISNVPLFPASTSKILVVSRI